ncbi:dynein regulatory complex subunit 6 [Megalops cyprinoides]|uniref:dynein regulatory complex subunit 6 n=1 Tax=Megalops cyprinoides TaxID=118141 RepID=UPI001864C6B9|nr:dynein regulatory complex subunit 6 [Megalops cyprinoides]
MASLQNGDGALRDFISKHSLPEVYQALLTGLCPACPETTFQLLEMKIMEIQENCNLEIDWNACIDAVQQVTMAALEGNMMHGIFGNLDDSTSLSHLFEKAYSYYRKNLTKLCFKAWVKYILRRRREAAELVLKMRDAELHHTQSRLKLALQRWIRWVQLRKHRQREALKKIEGVWNAVHCKTVLRAWQCVVRDSKKTKEYFERLEKGLLEAETYDTPTPPGDGEDGVSLLPWKLALKIFQNLEFGDLVRCGQVCRTWNAITQTCSLWSQINFSTEKQRIVDSAVVQVLQKYRPFVVHLNMRGCSLLQWPSLTCISDCRNLQELNLSECASVNDEAVGKIVEGCSVLLYLNLSYTAITNSSFRALSRCCLSLRYLSLAYCKRFTDKGLQYLAAGKGCHRIIYLDLLGCTQVSAPALSVPSISADGFRHVGVGCRLLERVELNGMATLTDSCVLAVVSRCSSLNAVSLLDAPHLSDSALRGIAEACKLRRIGVEGNNRITDAGWKAVCRSSPCLRHIHAVDCRGLTDVSMRAIGSLKSLISLNVADCVRVSDVGLRWLVDGPSGPRIQELDLSSCVRVGDSSLMRIVQKCTSLKHLKLCYCDHLTDAGVEWLGGASSLISLDLSGTNIQDQSLTALGNNPGLKRLNLSECLWITDIGVEKFCRQVRGLEHMDVSHCLSLSDQAIKALSFYCRTIISLRMAGCPKMTDLAVQYLMGAGLYLRELDVSGCVHLTDRSTRLLQKGCQRLRSVTMLYCRGISKQAALKLRHRVRQWEHSRDDVPSWYGYNTLGQLLRPIPRLDTLRRRRGQQE